MLRRPVCLVVILFTAGCASTASRSTERRTAESEVRVAESQRFEAMLRQDATALDTLLDADLTYVHTGGDLETKAQFVEVIRSKKLIYESIAPSEVRVRVHDGFALATGRSQMRVRNATGVSSFGIRFTEVYVRRAGRWLLTGWEATRLAQ